MFLDNIIPSNDLSEFIRKYTIVDVAFPQGQPVPFKAYPPHPQDCLEFHPKDTEVVTIGNSPTHYSGKRIVITGQFTCVSNRHIGRKFLVLQVVFKPGALHRLAGIPANELNNTYLDADLILGNEVHLVNEQLYHAKSYREMIETVEFFLRKRVKRKKKQSHYLDIIADKMLFNYDDQSLDSLAREACLCYRQFGEKFKERIGVNPKLFMRIIRFFSAYKMKNKFPKKDWLTIALHCGYHDYQHLVKDYRIFTGLTPTRFFEIELKSPERRFGGVET
jgi:AraC-like DNA-binding protein